MTILLVGVALYTIFGGMLSVLVTDFLQFIVMSAGLIAVTVLILVNIGWEKIVTTVEVNHGAGGFNPFVHPDLGWQYVLFQFLLNFAAVLTWQTTIARVLAAKDTKTGQKIYTRTSFFFVCRFLIPGIWGIAALAYLGWSPAKMLTHEDLAGLSPEVQQKIAETKAPTALVVAKSNEEYLSLSPEKQKFTLTLEEDKSIPKETRKKLQEISLNSMPSFLGLFVPIGLIGLCIAAMLAADMSTDSSYMLSWGSVIYNDILAPFRKGKWSEKKGLFWNRTIVALIGLFLLFYGLWYPLEGDVWTYLGITGTIYLASISVILIACCYWKRANSWGAVGSIFFAAFIPITYLVLEKTQPETAKAIGAYTSGIAAYVCSALAMVIGSTLKNMIGGKSE
jgi:SSS family solute:Na+ symporter